MVWLRRRWLHAALVAAALIGVVLLVRSDDTSSGLAQARPAPRFVALSLDSARVERSLDDYAGYPVLLNVWATWCDPCREEMPSLERLYRDYRPLGLRIVAVSIDDAGNEALMREFAKEHRLSFDILHDRDGNIMSQYGVLGVPQTFLISRDHSIIGTRFAADWSSSANRTLVDSLLRIGER